MTSEHLLEHLSPHLLDRGPEAGWTSSYMIATFSHAQSDAISNDVYRARTCHYCLLVSCSQFAQQAFGLEDKRARDETTLAA